MNSSTWLGRLFGYEHVSDIVSWNGSFAASWAADRPGLVLLGCLILGALTVLFYRRYQPATPGRTRLLFWQVEASHLRVALMLLRTGLLSLPLLILADPVLELHFTSQPKPLLWLLIDDTESMRIEDKLPDEEERRLADAVGLPRVERGTESGGGGGPVVADAGEPSGSSAGARTARSRGEYVKALLERDENNLLRRLREKYRLQAFVLDRADGVRMLPMDEHEGEFQPRSLTEKIEFAGTVTALGSAFHDLGLRYSAHHLAGVLVISDFDQNSGPAPLAPARRLGVPISTVGVGPRSAVDLAVELDAPVKFKKGEQSSINVMVRQQGLEGQTTTVRLSARRLDAESGHRAGEVRMLGEKKIVLERTSQSVEFPFVPEETGRFALVADAAPLAGEIVDQNNRVERETSVIDDYLRLLFVEYEPTWEWRFIKEVFHRDRLVGVRGFRTFLSSSDIEVRKTNELFVSNLTPPRSDFFRNDVIFLGDMPADSLKLSTRFCDMTREFVSRFGGGLVVIAGPRFGPSALAETPLADMLPVILDPEARPRDQAEFTLKLAPAAFQYDFMRLGEGEDDDENRRAWANLGRLPWYYPVKRLEPGGSTLLAGHPTDKCSDGVTPQPLIAIRKYGRGEVVYIGFNEMWRLRRKHGEKYYRAFWGQMIHRLGLSHALGSQKRFVVHTDRQRYQSDDKVVISVEAYNEDFEPLTDDMLAKRGDVGAAGAGEGAGEGVVPTSGGGSRRTLAARLIRPGGAGSLVGEEMRIRIPMLRPGLFEIRLPVFATGDYSLIVTDPITGKEVDPIHFQVATVSAERRSALRNYSIQQNLALETGGKTYELDQVDQFLTDFDPPRLTESSIQVVPLWSTPLCFLVFLTLAMSEWFLRKLVNLA